MKVPALFFDEDRVRYTDPGKMYELGYKSRKRTFCLVLSCAVLCFLNIIHNMEFTLFVLCNICLRLGFILLTSYLFKGTLSSHKHGMSHIR